ncbi:unnamed protein product [Dracunculus medinensis]|uniref:CSRNP_N domain-containing protein n=1 Tax=Dracunculus medinensis TaxID=318479 RepID=A0A0N4U8G9_DRAME|nr:unnamed protein product [Dracunculus medinensis]
MKEISNALNYPRKFRITIVPLEEKDGSLGDFTFNDQFAPISNWIYAVSQYIIQPSMFHDDDKTFYNSLKPLSSKMRERILKSAGVALDQSEILENNEIRSRRKSCGCNCIQCEPETCYCTLTGINCQVDEPQFPCSCAKSCNNPYGRIAFRSSLVRIHHQQTLKRLKASQKREETVS